MLEGIGDDFVTGADVDEQRGVVGNLGGQQLGNTALGIQVEGLARAVGGVDGARLEAGAAVHAADQAFRRQGIEVATNGLGRDIEMAGELLDGGISLALYQCHDGILTFPLIHATSLMLSPVYVISPI